MNLGRGEFGDGFGSFGDGVLREFSGEEEFDGGLDLLGREGSSVVVSDEFGGLDGDSLEDVVHEGVHDVHGLLGDADIIVDLLEDLVDVQGEGLASLSSSGLDGLSALGGGGGLLGGSHLI